LDRDAKQNVLATYYQQTTLVNYFSQPKYQDPPKIHLPQIILSKKIFHTKKIGHQISKQI